MLVGGAVGVCGSGTFARVIGRRVLVGGTVVAVGWSTLAACTTGSEGASVTDTGPARELAPSQVTAVTAAPPDTPPPCDADELTLWTAQVMVVGEFADAVVRVRNDGASWCEVDVAGSPSVDPAMEPDVWLDPGEWADLVVGPPDGDCAAPAAVTLAQLDVNGEQVVVPTAAVVPCGWRLTAFYPNEVADLPCDEVVATAVERAIVVRNDGAEPCRLGALETADGDGVTIVPAAPDVEVPVLAAGDLVAFELDRVGAPGVARPVVLGFESGANVEVVLDADAVALGAGPPQPWLGGPLGPDAGDPVALLAALDPF